MALGGEEETGRNGPGKTNGGGVVESPALKAQRAAAAAKADRYILKDGSPPPADEAPKPTEPAPAANGKPTIGDTVVEYIMGDAAAGAPAVEAVVAEPDIDPDVILAPMVLPATEHEALDRVEAFYSRFIAYPSDHTRVAHVLWTAHTHVIDCFETTPRLAVMSAEKASGKTRLLEVTALFVPHARLSFSMSAAALVRIIAQGHEDGNIPTILFDEIDNLFARSEEGIAELRGALNSGYRRNATSSRCVNRGAGVEDFPCFAPLAVAGLKTLPDTLASRAIEIRMRRRAPDESVESFRLRIHPKQSDPIEEVLHWWCRKHKVEMAKFEPTLPEGITDRDADCWEPLLTIADFAGGDWSARARAAAKALTGITRDAGITAGVELLQHIKEAFGDRDKLWTITLINLLCERDESPWQDVFRGKALNDRGLADRLKPYGIKSKQVKIGIENHQGYYAAHFADAWNRYLPAGDPTDQGDPTDPTDPTILLNKDNLVGAVGAVGARKPKCSACDDLGCPTCQPRKFGIGVE